MNLETFKARARRKLELTPSARPAASATTSEATGIDVEQKPEEPANTAMTPTDPAPDIRQNDMPQPLRSDKLGTKTSGRVPGLSADQSPTGSQVANSGADGQQAGRAERRSYDHTNASSETKLEHLRTLLLGDSTQSQQQQMEVVSQRTHAEISSLRRDMDGRLRDLAQYVEQLEQSILNGVESHERGLSASAEERLARHDQRLSDLDYRLSGALETMRAEASERQQANQQLLQEQIASVNSRTDTLVRAVTERLERSIDGMQAQISDQISSQSQTLLGDSTSSLNSMEERVTRLIDERVSKVNADQSVDLNGLRTMLLNNTSTIKEELRLQTDEQRANLVVHRKELEDQFIAAMTQMRRSMVTHSDLSSLLSRLADRVQHL